MIEPKLDGRHNNPGRPRNLEPTVTVGVRLTQAQRAKLRRLGGPPWLRKRIVKARIPTEP